MSWMKSTLNWTFKLWTSPRYVGMHSDELEKTGYSFCNIENADNYTSKLCKGPLLFRYFEPAAFSRAIARSTTVFVTWSTLIHGNWFSLLLNFITYRRLIPEENNKFVSITLNLERLSSNPTYGLLACNINDLFSWVSVKPLSFTLYLFISWC